MEPSDYFDVSIHEVLQCIRSVGLIKGCIERAVEYVLIIEGRSARSR
jgi:hypothetical protein